MACALVPAQGRRSHCLDLTRSLLDLSWPPRSLLRTSRGCRRSSRRCGRPNCVPSASLCRKQGLCGRPASLRQASWPRLAAPRCRPGHPLALVKPARRHFGRTSVGLGFDLGASGCARCTAASCGTSSTAGLSRRCATRCSKKLGVPSKIGNCVRTPLFPRVNPPHGVLLIHFRCKALSLLTSDLR